MANFRELRDVIEFPQGSILIFGKHAPETLYFRPLNDPGRAYEISGNHSELMGKHVWKAFSSSKDVRRYHFTFEKEGDDLLAARLVSEFARVSGVLLSDDTKRKIAAKVHTGEIVCVTEKSPPYIMHVAKFSAPDDNRLIVMVEDPEQLKNPRSKGYRTLHIVENGIPRQIADQPIQGGNSFYFNGTEDGVNVSLPYGYGAPIDEEPPMYGKVLLEYVKVEKPYDLAQYGFKKEPELPHLDPFYYDPK